MVWLFGTLVIQSDDLAIEASQKTEQTVWVSDVFNDIGGDADVTRTEALVLGKGLVLFAGVDPDLKWFRSEPRRTLAYQEVILRIGPLAKLIEAM
jgi:hypothetical protein